MDDTRSPADDGGARFRLTLKFPDGEELEVRIARSQLLERSTLKMTQMPHQIAVATEVASAELDLSARPNPTLIKYQMLLIN
jgi:hypothetical protein